MPYVLQINGRTVVLDDQDARGMLDQLVRQTRIQLWNRAGGPDSYFSHYYRVWEQHNRCHAVNLFVLTMEALGGANLPPANWANRLRRTQQQLGRMIRPASIGNFYQQYPNWNRGQARFVRDMKTYMNRMQLGAGRTITVLELTRDSSFVILGVCASILTAGAASGPAAAAASSTSGALVRAAASQFLVNQISSSATRLGRSLAGERVTTRETVDDIVNSALQSVPDAMLGGIIGKFMGPLTNRLSVYAGRELARGSLIRGVTLELSRSQIEAAIGRAVDRMLGRQPIDIRRILESSAGERDNRGHANVMADGLMQNRNFRRLLGEELQNQA